MNKGFNVSKGGVFHKIIICSVVCFFIFNAFIFLAQTGNPVYEEEVNIPESEDSIANVANSMKREVKSLGIMPAMGNYNGNPNAGSIHVNRDAKYRAFSPQQLIDSIFVKGGACSSVKNVILTTHGWNKNTSSWTSTDNRGLGYFTKGTSNFEFNEGLVLSTGGLASMEGPNIGSGWNNNYTVEQPSTNAGVNDPDLRNLVPGYNIINSTILEFDFVPIGNRMVFKYVFASEEYSDFVNTPLYNDVFGFFITEPDGTKHNIALLPDSNGVVSINNVNWGYDATTYNTTGATNTHNCIKYGQFGNLPSNPDYYINIPVGPGGEGTVNCPVVLNSRDDTLRKSMEFDGRTMVLTAEFDVERCKTYHLKLAVGNAGDNNFQSGVFLEAYSFDIGDFLVNWGSMNRGQDFLYRGCDNNMFELIRVGSGVDTTSLDVFLEYLGPAAGNIESLDGSPMPTLVTIPPGKDTAQVHYKVNWNDLSDGEKDLIIKVNCPCDGQGYTEKLIKLYDPSDTLKATATYACEGVNNGTIIVSGVGGSGNYESSIDSGVTWLPHTTNHTGLPPDTFQVLIRDVGGCTIVKRTVSTIMYTSITGDLDICPPSYATTLTTSGGTGVNPYQWFKDGVAISGATAQTYIATEAGKYSVTMRNGSCYSNLGDTVTVSSANCLWADADYATTLVNIPVKIPVLNNDLLSICTPSTINVTISASPSASNGTAVVNGDKTITFTPALDFVGKTIFRYQIECGGITSDTTITVLTLQYPDNISDADCFVDSVPAKPWSITEHATYPVLGESNTYWTQSMGTPLVADLDGDGYPEIITPAIISMTPTWQFSDGLFIVDLHKNTERVIPTPVFRVAGQSIAIGDVDGDGIAEIYLQANDKKIYCYNGKTGASITLNHTAALGRRAVLSLADLNNDGVPELVAGNHIFDAKTGKLLLQMTLNPSGTGGGRSHDGAQSGTGGTLADSTYLMPAIGDIDNDGLLEIVGGNTIYKPVESNGTWSYTTKVVNISPNVSNYDGQTVLIDFDLDGQLDIVVISQRTYVNLGPVQIYIWNPKTLDIIAYSEVLSNKCLVTIPYIGDLNGDGRPEIVFGAKNKTAGGGGNGAMYLFAYDENEAGKIKLKATDTSLDETAGYTLFDFNQDGKNEIVGRNDTKLFIIDGTALSSLTPLTTLSNVYSPTVTEYPVVADIDLDGSAEIIINKAYEIGSGTGPRQIKGAIAVYKSGSGSAPWAPARKVWNQWLYNPVYVNEDLTIPQYQVNPATLFPGVDNVMGTADDVRPYNNFLQQATTLSKKGLPLWLTPDVYLIPSLSNAVAIGDSVFVNVCFGNKGDAPIGSPVYATLYKDNISSANKIVTGFDSILVNPGDTGCITIIIPDIKPYLPFLNIIVRINDNGTDFPYQLECEEDNNELTLLNPTINLMMKKNATLNPGNFQHNGTYPNPVSVLYGEEVEYTITAVNVSLNAGSVIIRDTLPPYMDYKANSANPTPTVGSNGGTPQRTTLEWTTLPPVGSMASTQVSFIATLQPGVSASQPMFINNAWVTINNIPLTVPTNGTFHQGAGISITTFSAGPGGQIYNAEEQALDYMTSPKSGIVIVPDEGYSFVGWSHDNYISLRGKAIEAKTNIMHYDTLTVYGNVELHANFEIEKYPIKYYLNGGTNIVTNPATYTIKSRAITLNAPEKTGDVFIGWTGGNGEEPQKAVTIPNGSVGELEYYANYLNSGRDNDIQKHDTVEDKIWAINNELYIRTSKAGSIVWIYSTEGVLQKLHTIITAGESKIKLPKGIYAVSLNSNAGKIVRIE